MRGSTRERVKIIALEVPAKVEICEDSALPIVKPTWWRCRHCTRPRERERCPNSVAEADKSVDYRVHAGKIIQERGSHRSLVV